MFFIKRIDWSLLVSSVLLSLLGIATLLNFSGESNFYAWHQVIWLLVSVFVYIVLSTVKLDFIRNGRVLLILFAFISLVLLSVFFFSHLVKGAQSRFYIFGFAVQPAEFAKIILALLLAKYFSRRHLEIANVKHIFISGFYTGVLFLLVAAQPDLGSALIFGAIWFFEVLASGISKKHLFIIIGGVILTASLAWGFVLKDYQKARIMVFVNPAQDMQGRGYNAYQSKVAVGSGEFLGKGLGLGTQSKLHFLPEYHTDFIFAAYAEEMGFVGVLLFFVIFLILMFRILKLGINSKDNFTRLFSMAACAVFLTHFIINVGMNIGLLPITGITLPFLSYGGSHLIMEYALLGILTSLSLEKRPRL